MVSLARRRTERTAFVLSGGGNLGALQVGMLRSLAEHGITADVVLGCSVGALNGAAYARMPTMAGIQRLERIWCDITSPTLMPSSRIPSALGLLRKGASLHDNDGLRATLESMLAEQSTFDDLEVPFECVATEVETARERWFSAGALVPAILASAALPAVFPPVAIDGRRYVDGGVVDNVPISRAVDLGCTLIYVLHVGPHGRPDVDLRRPIDGALLAYWLARNSRFARDLASLPDGTEAVVLPPGARPELKYDDFDQTEALIDQGRTNTDAFLTERAAEIEAEREARTIKARLGRLRAPTARLRELAERAAVSPGGAIVAGAGDPDSEDPDSEDPVSLEDPRPLDDPERPESTRTSGGTDTGGAPDPGGDGGGDAGVTSGPTDLPASGRGGARR